MCIQMCYGGAETQCEYCIDDATQGVEPVLLFAGADICQVKALVRARACCRFDRTLGGIFG